MTGIWGLDGKKPKSVGYITRQNNRKLVLCSFRYSHSLLSFPPPLQSRLCQSYAFLVEDDHLQLFASLLFYFILKFLNSYKIYSIYPCQTRNLLCFSSSYFCTKRNSSLLRCSRRYFSFNNTRTRVSHSCPLPSFRMP